MPQDDQALSEALGPGGADVVLPEHLQHHRVCRAHRARRQVGPQDQTRSDEHTEVGEGVVANAGEPQRRRPAPPDRRKDEEERGQPEVGRGQSEDGEGAAHVVAQGVLLDGRVNPDGHSDQLTDEDRHQTQLDGDQQPAADQRSNWFRLQQWFAEVAAQQDAAHPAAVLHISRHVQTQSALELFAVDGGAATSRLRHPEHEEVDDVAGDEAHREEHQNGDQEKGRDQQQDTPDNVRSHLISVGETSRVSGSRKARGPGGHRRLSGGLRRAALRTIHLSGPSRASDPGRSRCRPTNFCSQICAKFGFPVVALEPRLGGTEQGRQWPPDPPQHLGDAQVGLPHPLLLLL